MNKKELNRREELNNRIKVLRHELNQTIDKNNMNLQAEEVFNKSCELDSLLLEYQKMYP